MNSIEIKTISYSIDSKNGSWKNLNYKNRTFRSPIELIEFVEQDTKKKIELEKGANRK